MEEEVTPHQAVAAAAEDVQAGTARDHDPSLIGVGVEEPLQERLPLPVLVQFVETDDSRGLPQELKAQMSGDGRRAAEDDGSVVLIVPAQDTPGCGESIAHGGLADLARTGEERHLAVVGQMLSEDPFVETLHARGHAGPFAVTS